MAFIRKIKTNSGTYLAEVKSVREGGKVRQKVLKYIGKEVNGQVVRQIASDQIAVSEVRRHADVVLLNHLAEGLGIREVLGPKASEILLFVYAQILDQKSICRLEDWLTQTDLLDILKIDSIGAKDLYGVLQELERLDFKVVQERLNKKWQALDNKNEAVVLDITDTYFSGSQADWSSRRGKDGVYGKLLQLAIAVSFQHGFPLSHRIYEGNISNKRILQDMLSELVKMGFSSIILDRGMYSAENIKRLTDAKFTAIVGVSKTPEIKRSFLKGIDREKIFSKQNQLVLNSTKLYATSTSFLGGALVAVFNPDAEVAQREEFLEKGQGNLKEQFFGYSLIYHNTQHSIPEIVRKYFEKDIVERSFRQLKGPLSLRPIRVWLVEHVSAHFKICYLAYALLAFLSYNLRNLKISPPDAIDKLKTAYRITLFDKKSSFSWSQTVTLSKIQNQILKAAKCSV
ncbi:MAG TPA: transposase [Oligoflexia bacterium]|nr:transposase [Oligoflexia bacterium]HMP27560.1 transposase [Oligoflexia bacterium]